MSLFNATLESSMDDGTPKYMLDGKHTYANKNVFNF